MGWGLNVGYASALVAASPWLAWRAMRTGRYRSGWPERLCGSVPKLADGRTSIWVHGVSLGEVQLLRPLIERLGERQPHHAIVLSTSTLTGMQLARQTLPDVPSFTCPWDFTWAMRRAVDRLKPALIVLGELELWPNWIDIARQRSVPVAIVNGRLSDRSLRGYRRARPLLAKTFAELSLVAAQDEATAERFRSLGVASERVHACGSIKFDNVNADREHIEVRRRAALVGLSEQHRVLVAGSTQDPEELAAMRAVASLLPKHPQLKLIVVPRHPERFDEVFRTLAQGGLKVIRRSALDGGCSADQWQVLLVDTVGELKWWWGLAELALVGGSFGSRGGQNMLEPAAYGAKVAFGPNTSNFRTIVRALLEKEAAWELPTLDALPEWIDDQLSRPEAGRARTARAVQWIASHQGATERTLALLDQLLEKHAP
ncbi:MAG: 3-deoxy-D-manno-octulosonic acid transferase [Aureliella sp.]